jgi:DNA-binding LacI/PurR family transcriptional regulator
MRVDSRQMGRMAVRLLRSRIQNPASVPTVTVVQPELVRRESV